MFLHWLKYFFLDFLTNFEYPILRCRNYSNQTIRKKIFNIFYYNYSIVMSLSWLLEMILDCFFLFSSLPMYLGMHMN